MINDTDLRFLEQALELAERGRYGASPNPMVGAVIVRDGQVLGQGWHRQVGGAHAEIEALRDASESVAGTTVYVSLEPCDFHGRTPPCSQALVDAEVARVVACHRDPNPRVSGGGFERLERAGIAVEICSLVDHRALFEQSVELNWQFLVAHAWRRPAVTVKWAMSLDGKIATAGGDSQWISGEQGRHWGLEQRESHDAILVGSSTALADDPRLNRRLGLAPGANTRVVLDRRLRLEPGARMLDIDGPLVVYTQAASDSKRRQQLRAAGAEVTVLAEVTPDAVLADLFERGVRSLLVEGGSEVAAAFVTSQSFDRVGINCAPLVIGGKQAPGPIAGDGFEPLASALRLEKLRCQSRGDDLILTAFRSLCLQDLCMSVGG